MEIYKTSDIYLAAYLRAKGHKIKEVERPRGKVYFCFEEDELLKKNKLRFFNDGLISVTKYKNALSDLKTIIHNT